MLRQQQAMVKPAGSFYQAGSCKSSRPSPPHTQASVIIQSVHTSGETRTNLLRSVTAFRCASPLQISSKH